MDHLILFCEQDVSQQERGEGYSGYVVDIKQSVWNKPKKTANDGYLQHNLKSTFSASTLIKSLSNIQDREDKKCETMPE